MNIRILGSALTSLAKRSTNGRLSNPTTQTTTAVKIANSSPRATLSDNEHFCLLFFGMLVTDLCSFTATESNVEA